MQSVGQSDSGGRGGGATSGGPVHQSDAAMASASAVVLAAGGGGGVAQTNASRLGQILHEDMSLLQSPGESHATFCISDPKLADNPIVFASPSFFQMTGYTPVDAIGRNCRFLQASEMDARSARRC